MKEGVPCGAAAMLVRISPLSPACWYSWEDSILSEVLLQRWARAAGACKQVRVRGSSMLGGWRVSRPVQRHHGPQDAGLNQSEPSSRPPGFGFHWQPLPLAGRADARC